MNDGFSRSLLRLPDDAFFDLMRNYLGPITTPFNKHDLISRLAAFLRRSSTQKQVLSRIDAQDAELLSAIWLLEEPTYDELFTFFASERDYLDLHRHLLNIEDRLLAYRDADRIRITEQLAPMLKRDVISVTWLFQLRLQEEVEKSANPPWLSDEVLVALFAFAAERPDFFKVDGGVRKRTVNELRDRIPVLATATLPGSAVTRAQLLCRALCNARLFHEEAGRVWPAADAWDVFVRLPATRRIGLIVSGWLGKESRTQLVAGVATALESIPGEAAITPAGVERLITLAAPDTEPELCRRARETLEIADVLHATGDGYLVRNPGPTTEGRQLIVQPNMDVTIPAGFPLEDALFVAHLARIGRHDRYPRYELTREHCAAALHSGTSIDTIIDRLSELSGALPQNVVTSLRSWADEYESMRLYDGAVLTARENRRHLIEHAERVRALIQKELAPGVYLVARDNVAELRGALEAAGVSMVPQITSTDGQPVRPLPIIPESVPRHSRISGALQEAVHKRPPALSSDDRWKRELVADLERRKLSGEQREELMSRIENKLILLPDQLKPGALRAERTEARGLDYAGKVRIIERAIRDGNFLELVERSAEGLRRRLVEPRELEKHGRDLILSADQLPERQQIEVAVRKLGLVRSIRAGLVTRPPHP
jgi:hypothetical protein